MNDRELLEHISGAFETNEKRGWWYTTVYSCSANMYGSHYIITVSMNKDEEGSIEDAINQLKQLMFTIVSFMEGKRIDA